MNAILTFSAVSKQAGAGEEGAVPAWPPSLETGGLRLWLSQGGSLTSNPPVEPPRPSPGTVLSAVQLASPGRELRPGLALAGRADAAALRGPERARPGGGAAAGAGRAPAGQDQGESARWPRHPRTPLPETEHPQAPFRTYM